MFQDEELSFWNHVEEMRSTLIWGLLVICLASGICFFCADQTIQLLSSPYTQSLAKQKEEVLRVERYTNDKHKPVFFYLPEGGRFLSGNEESEGTWLAPGEKADYLVPATTQPLLLFSPLEGFLAAIKVSMWLGFVVTAPIWGFLVLRFVLPALKEGGRRAALVLYAAALLFFYCGVGFAFLFTIPIATRFLYQFGGALGANFWGLSSYLDYIVSLTLANGLVFELCVLLGGLVHFGVLTDSQLRSKRRYVAVGIFLLGAIVTPPDVITQCLVALPLLVLYEGVLLFAKWKATTEQQPHPQEESV